MSSARYARKINPNIINVAVMICIKIPNVKDVSANLYVRLYKFWFVW